MSKQFYKKEELPITSFEWGDVVNRLEPKSSGYEFEVPSDDAVEKIVSVAAGSVESEELAKWINQYLREIK